MVPWWLRLWHVVLFVAVVLLLSMLVYAIYVVERDRAAEYRRLYAECMQDGHKEYQCRGWLRRGYYR